MIALGCCECSLKLLSQAILIGLQIIARGQFHEAKLRGKLHLAEFLRASIETFSVFFRLRVNSSQDEMKHKLNFVS